MTLALPPYDTHVHSYLSGHSDGRMKPDHVRSAAAARKLKAVVFLEHVPQIIPREPTTAWYARKNNRAHLNELLPMMEAARTGPPALVMGVEVDVDPVLLDGSTMLDNFPDIGFPVLAMHVLPGGKTFWFDTMRLPEPIAKEMLRGYVKSTRAALSSGKFRAWAHPGALIAAGGLLPDFSRESIAPLEEILSAMADHDVAFELNELLARKIGGVHLATYHELVETARSWGIRFVTGSDAHAPESIGVFKWVLEVAGKAHLTSEDFVGVEEVAGSR